MASRGAAIGRRAFDWSESLGHKLENQNAKLLASPARQKVFSIMTWLQLKRLLIHMLFDIILCDPNINKYK